MCTTGETDGSKDYTGDGWQSVVTTYLAQEGKEGMSYCQNVPRGMRLRYEKLMQKRVMYGRGKEIDSRKKDREKERERERKKKKERGREKKREKGE